MIIGLTGYARSGKDTVAKVLVDNYGFERIAFADPIRELLLRINPILNNGYHLNEHVREFGWELAKSRTEVRRLLQDLGVGARDILGADIWVTTALKKMSNTNKNYVITDVRFQNEASTIKVANGVLWRVERPNVSAVNNHVSESELSEHPVDITLLNNGTIEDLVASVKARMVGLLV